MISQKYINGLGFNTLEEVFQYVVDSRQNGQFSQVKELVKRMSTDQHNQFIIWLHDNRVEVYKVFLRGVS